MRTRRLMGAARSCWAGRLLLALAGGLAVACSGAHEPAERSAEGTHRLGTIRPTADVPALLGHSIDGLRQRLGAGQEATGLLADTAYFAELAPYSSDSLLAFRTGGLLLLASYDVRSRRVHDLFLPGQYEDSLMRRAALRSDAPNYLVLPAFRHDAPGRLLGLRVVPAQRR